MTSNSQSNLLPDNRLDESRATLAFAQRALVATCVVVSVLVVLIFIWYAADLFMLVFASVLVSILLRTFAEFVTRKSKMGHGFALILVSLGLVVLIAITAWLVTGRIGTQVAELRLQLPEAVRYVTAYLGQYDWARNALESFLTFNDWLARRGGTVVPQLTGLVSTTAGVVVNILIVGILGIYLASQPSLYSRGLKHLLPLSYRERAGEVLTVIDEAFATLARRPVCFDGDQRSTHSHRVEASGNTARLDARTACGSVELRSELWTLDRSDTSRADCISARPATSVVRRGALPRAAICGRLLVDSAC